MMTNYTRGYAFERATADALEADGYWTCQSRGSHGLADVVAIKPGEVLLVQCKLGRMPHDEWNGLFALASHVGAVPVVADKPKRGVVRFRRITSTHTAGSKAWPADDWKADEAA